MTLLSSAASVTIHASSVREVDSLLFLGRRHVLGQVVLNNFGDKQASSQVKLMKVTLQNMFPSINVATVKLQDCRRVVMFNLDKTSGTVEMRHFAVRATPTGITKAIKKVRRCASVYD